MALDIPHTFCLTNSKTFLARLKLKQHRLSAKLWQEYCDSLEPGVVMDALVDYYAFARYWKGYNGTGRFHRKGHEIPLYSSRVSQGIVIYLAMLNNDQVSVSRIHWEDYRHTRKYYDQFQCKIGHMLGDITYGGCGMGKTRAEAVCRAILALYGPSEDELANNNAPRLWRFPLGPQLSEVEAERIKTRRAIDQDYEQRKREVEQLTLESTLSTITELEARAAHLQALVDQQEAGKQ